MADDIVLKVDVDTGDADKELKDLNKNLDKTGKNAKVVGKEAKGGFSGMIKGVKGVGMALKTAGIGIFLAVLAGLFKLLKENQAVMDFFNKATRVMSILFAKLTDALIPVKDALMSAFEDPKQAVIDLWEVIKENMVNRITGMIDFFKQSFSGLVNTIQGSALAIKGIFSDEAKQKSKEFFDAAKKDALAAGESFLQMSTGIDDLPGKLKKGFDVLKEVVTDAVEGADKYVKKQNELLLAEAELNKFIAGNRLELEKLKTTREDETKSIEERIAASDEMMELIKEEEDRAIRLQEEKIALMKLDKDQTQTTIEDLAAIANAEAELDNLRTKAVVSNLENLKFANTLRKQEADKIIAAEKEKQDKIKELEDEKAAYILSLEESTIEHQLEAIEEERELIQELYDEKLISYEAFLMKKQELDDQYAALTIDTTKLTEEEKINIVSKSLQAISQINSAVMGLMDAMMQKELKAAEGNEKKQEEIQKRYGEKKKRAAVVGVIIDAASAIIGTWAGYSSMGVPGMILAGIQTGLIGTLAAIQLATISQQQFAQGGVLNGPSHAQGGIITPFGELEGGEGVINNRSMSTPSLRNLASAANTGGGGNDFSTGDGSIKLSAESISMIVNGINNKKVVVSEVDITEVQNRVKVIEAEATL